ncbi:2-isopropylmalate synthase [Entomobacter blattae]|uniref:2-isopropylmalate synthase n=1 Tax=Entomobacter blattae TaxID=2762277 RepID=A0A7H1NNT1_9PROT|nr:2-isopropylmalate synthase [Entomobacter blattae]QNT77441.1 2-isopropylmalate synthase [Entomobacter blattae]
MSSIPPNRVLIFDTTLRDGEQAPGFSMNRQSKLRMASMLEDVGVDILEAGFPAASPDDATAVNAIAKTLHQTTICALARCQSNDIETAARALEGAHKSRIHVFISTSPLHREFKLGKSKEEIIEMAIKGITQARPHCGEVEFSAEDALRTEPDYLVEIFNAAIKAGATILNVPDTVGYTTPNEIFRLFNYLKQNIKNSDSVILSTHCHDDLGMATANSLSAVEAGARQIECALNGIGERAGNAALEEVIMALKVRKPYYDVYTETNSQKLTAASRLLTQITGQPIARNKAIVGENAFAHESGIHQHGMLKNRDTYEIMRPEDVGITQTRLVLGKHSGRAALQKRLNELGYDPDNTKMDDIFVRFKKLADKKREIHEEDLHALIMGNENQNIGPWAITHMRILSSYDASMQDSPNSASVEITLHHHNEGPKTYTAYGDGPVDAVFLAIEHICGTKFDVHNFQIKALSEGRDAQGEARLEIKSDHHIFGGYGINTDIVAAAAQAALTIVNNIENGKKRKASSIPASSRTERVIL